MRKPASNGKRQPRSRPAVKSRRAVRHCDALISAIHNLERSLCGMHEPSAQRSARFLAQLAHIRVDLNEHIRLTEGPQGLLTMVDDHAPRLTRHVRRLKREHRELSRQLDYLEAAVRRCGEPKARPAVFDRACERARNFLQALRHHQESGTELVFQAYMSDIGTAD
jgi:iron-sulfur cluster repair protein YtfE (RIC family)